MEIKPNIFIRGPIWYDQEKYLAKNNLPSSEEYKINLGGPSSETLRKLKSVDTWVSGILKNLILSHNFVTLHI